MSQLFAVLRTSSGPLVKPYSFGLFIGRGSEMSELPQFAALLSLQGPVKVLDGGNHFNVFDVAYAIRKMTADLYRASDNIHVIRAFTCIEVLRGLEEMPAGSPVLLLDLLATFYDDAVSDRRAEILFERCLAQIHRLRQSAPVIASTSPAPQEAGREQFVASLIAAADVVENRLQGIEQESPRLF